MAEPTARELMENQIITGERNYEQALDNVIASAKRELLIFDADFCKGAYNSRARYALLRDFLASGRHNRLAIVLHETGYFTSHCSLIHELLAVYGHAMTVYETGEQAKAARDCFVVADRKHYLRRFHIDHARFKYALDDKDTANMLNCRFNELLEASSQSMAATRLGL